MRGALLVLTLFVVGYAHPLCSDTTTAVTVNNLQFCTQYIQNGSCCNYDTNLGGKTYKDVTVQANFTAMGLTRNTACGDIMQQIMCTKCDPWAAHLRGDISAERSVPYLCSSYCPNVYTACKDVTMNATLSPFGVAKIADRWPTQAAFCQDYAVADGYCFSGTPYVDPAPANFVSNQGLCLDRVVAQPTGSPYITSTSISSVANPDRLLLATREGVVSTWRVTSRGPFINLGTFLDIRPRVWQNGEGGLLGMAYHPQDSSRFFVSYICNPAAFDDCRWDRQCNTTNDCLYASICLPSGRCGCTNSSHCTDGGVCTNGICNSAAGQPNHVQMTIIAEYAVNPTNPLVAIATEKKRVLVASRQGANHNGGQILFGPDGYLYAFMGDGGGNGARGSQLTNSFMGKVIRIDVTQTTPGYAIPPTNPFIGNATYRPEIYAQGLRNPWRSSFDPNTGTLWTGDVGDQTIEEINQILPGKNYGWRKFEGSIQWNPDNIDPKPTRDQNTPPKMSYTHASMRPNPGACIIGGYWYRGTKNTCFANKYLFSDQLGAFFYGSEDGVGSGLYSNSRVSWACGSDASSALKCNSAVITTIFSLADDTAKNVYWLTDQGVFQLVESNRCPAIDCNAVPSNSTASSTSAAQTSAPNTVSSAISSTTAVSTVATTGRVAVAGDYDLLCNQNAYMARTGSRLYIPTCTPCQDGGYERINLPPSDESNVYKIDDIYGNYNKNINGGLGFISLAVDAGNHAQQTTQARIRYDFDGDGKFDRIEIFDKWPTNDLEGWENYTLTNNRFFEPGTVGNWQNFTGGSIDLYVWQSSGNYPTSLVSGGSLDAPNGITYTSFIQIPFDLTNNNCRYLILGSAVVMTTGQVTTGVMTTGQATTGMESTTQQSTAQSSTIISQSTTGQLTSDSQTSQSNSQSSSGSSTSQSSSSSSNSQSGSSNTNTGLSVTIGLSSQSGSNLPSKTTSASTRSSNTDEIEEDSAPILFNLMVFILALLLL